MSNHSKANPAYPPAIGTTEGGTTVEQSGRRGIVASSPPSVVPVSAFDILDSPRKWFEKAQAGDAQAGISVFLLLRHCMKFARPVEGLSPSDLPTRSTNTASKSNDCSVIPENFAADPLRWLEPAARAGSLDARALYGTNAEVALIGLRNDATLSEARIKEISENALSYLGEAASYGNRSAFSRISDAYERGALGQVDLVKAYAFARAAAELTGDPVLERRAAVLAARLRPYDLSIAQGQARTLAAACCRELPRTEPSLAAAKNSN